MHLQRTTPDALREADGQIIRSVCRASCIMPNITKTLRHVRHPMSQRILMYARIYRSGISESARVILDFIAAEAAPTKNGAIKKPSITRLF
mgnify:CR=1 FL=1